jgi:hypothetical protein
MNESLTTYIEDILMYLNMRAGQIDGYVATEQLSGNESKLMAEKSARAEIEGVIKFIEQLEI